MSDGQSPNCRNSRQCILGLGAVTQTPRNASTAPQYYFGAINAKLRCMGVNPFECGVIVLKRAGIMRLRSQPIVHGNDDAVAIYRDPLQPGQQPGVGHHEAAAMHVKQHRLAPSPTAQDQRPTDEPRVLLAALGYAAPRAAAREQAMGACQAIAGT